MHIIKRIFVSCIILQSYNLYAADKTSDYAAGCAAVYSSIAQLKTMYQGVADAEAQQLLHIGKGMIVLAAANTSVDHAFGVYESKRKLIEAEALKYAYDPNGNRSKVRDYVLTHLSPQAAKCSKLSTEFDKQGTKIRDYLNVGEGKIAIDKYNKSIMGSQNQSSFTGSAAEAANRSATKAHDD